MKHAPRTSSRLQLEAWTRALRHAGRALRRAPGFSAAVFCSLVVCLGPNAAVLSALYALVLKPLPFPHPEQLVTAANVAEKSGGQRVVSSLPQYLDFRAHADLFSAVATVRHESATLDDDTAPRRVAVDRLSGDFFAALGVAPVLGRFFAAEEEIAGRERVLVVSERFWVAQFGADSGVIGRSVRLDGSPFRIVGVAPQRVECLYPTTAFFQPYAPAAAKFDPQARYRGDAVLVARLKPDVSLEAGRAQLAALETTFEKTVATPATRAFIANARFRLALEPLRPGEIGSETNPLWLLQGGALLVLLIGAANVANLFLARLNARRGELAVRVALGASRGELLRQTLAESFLLTGAAAVAGLALAAVGLRLFNAYLPALMPGAPELSLDPTVLGATAAAALGIAVCVAVLPLHLLWRSGLQAGLGSGRTTSVGGGARRASGLLVVAQVGLAVTLLAGAGLLLRSFAKVMAIEPGFDATRIVQGRISLPRRYDEPADNLAVRRRILDALRTIPGVESAAESLDSVIVANERPVPFSTRATAADGGAESRPLIHIDAVSPEFFATMGMRVLSGRGFDAGDDFVRQPVAIVDERFAQRYLSGRVVEGQEIYLYRGLPLAVDGWPRIVGVVNRATLRGLDASDDLPIVFVPTVGYRARNFEVLVRSTRPAAEVAREMSAKLRELDPSIPFYAAGSLEEGLDRLLVERRGITWLLGLFSALALVLAGIGLYGVLSCEVSQRTREIGIRGAIGATQRQIVGLILRQGFGRVAVGFGFGLAGAAALTRWLGALLFGIGAADPWAYAAVVLALGGVALIACWLPARRAAKVDPIVALRAE